MILKLPALSILQPWAWLIVRGFKDIENRTWKDWNPGLKFRGEFLIHAGKGFDKDFDWMMADDLIGGKMPPISFFDNLRGGIVGKAEIVDCVTQHDSPWFFGHYGFVICNAQPLPFMPCKGQLGFFNVDYRGQE